MAQQRQVVVRYGVHIGMPGFLPAETASRAREFDQGGIWPRYSERVNLVGSYEAKTDQH